MPSWFTSRSPAPSHVAPTRSNTPASRIAASAGYVNPNPVAPSSRVSWTTNHRSVDAPGIGWSTAAETMTQAVVAAAMATARVTIDAIVAPACRRSRRLA